MNKTSNISVCVRIRPLLASENTPILRLLDENILLLKQEKNGRKKEFGFDCVLGADADQQIVYEKTAKPLLHHVLDGYNATVFAYGATGCGKTYTITGSQAEPGLIYLTMDDLFNTIQSRPEWKVDLCITFLEVYNETIRDLLVPNQKSKALEIREDASGIIVAGLSEHIPQTKEDVMKLLLKGNENRTKAYTAANAASSRSHAVLQIHIKQQPTVPIDGDNIKTATLSIIDLAGSERASKTLNKGVRLNEGANINRSLLALVVMIANVSPALVHGEETHNTLKYADRAKEIRTKLSQNTINISQHISQYPKIIHDLRAEVCRLRKSEIDLNALVEEREQVAETMRRCLVKSAKLFDKMVEKELYLIKVNQIMERNDQTMDYLKDILVLVNDATELDEKRHLNDSLLKLNEYLDTMHQQNAIHYHNRFEASVALERYSERLEGLSAAHSSPLFKSQWELEYAKFQRDKASIVAEAAADAKSALYQDLKALLVTFVSKSISFGKRSSDKISFTKALSDLLHSLCPTTSKETVPIPDVDYFSTTDDGGFETDCHQNDAPSSPKDIPYEIVKDFVQGFDTPKKSQMHYSEGENEATPVQVKKKVLRKTHHQSARKRKARMSLIPQRAFKD